MIDPVLARKIDRFSRRAHGFHRFAHHPLCGAYRGEVVAWGRWRICKGCLLAGAGLGAGLAAGALAPLAPHPWALLGLWTALVLALTRWRPPKTLSRFLPAALGAFLLLQGAREGHWSASLLVLAISALFLRAYRHKGPHRAPCESCPEQKAIGVCSGYKAQARRERAFQRFIRNWY